MGDEQSRLPGMGDDSERQGRRTLRDLVASQAGATGSHLDSFLAAPGTSSSGGLRLGFPSSDQLARFVAGQHELVLEGLPLPGPLRHVAGGHLERKRFHAGGRACAPDLVLVGPEGEQVLVFVASPLSERTRLPDPHSIEIVASLGHDAHGVLVTPDPVPEVAEIIESHLATFPEAHGIHWVRYRIEMEIFV